MLEDDRRSSILRWKRHVFEIAKKELAIQERPGRGALTSGPMDHLSPLFPPPLQTPSIFLSHLLAPSSSFSRSVKVSDVSLPFSLFLYFRLVLSLPLSQKCQVCKTLTRCRKVLFSCYVGKNASRSCQNYVTTIFECCLTPTNGVLGSREELPPPIYDVFFFLYFFFFLFFTGTSTTTTTTITIAAAARPSPLTTATGASSTSPSRETRSSGKESSPSMKMLKILPADRWIDRKVDSRISYNACKIVGKNGNEREPTEG